MNGLLQQKSRRVEEVPMVRAGREIWDLLQQEKVRVGNDISAAPQYRNQLSGMQESEASEEYEREVEWRHRGYLEARLRELNEAQARLVNGSYGFCTDCGNEIDNRRLAADLAVPLCVGCQESIEAEKVFWLM